MRIDVVTIFPEMFGPFLGTALLGKAIGKGLLEVAVCDLRDFAHDKHRQVDDEAYGGGPGMVLKPEPVFEAVESLQPGRVVLLSPQGRRFNQEIAARYASLGHLILVCGRYEGVDERVAQHLAHEELSIGDVVLAGGEVAAMVVIEAVSRLIPGVVGTSRSVSEDSFQTGLLDHPHYTRPARFRDWDVPEVLLSGDHARVDAWRREQARRRTLERRPDLLSSDAASLGKGGAGLPPEKTADRKRGGPALGDYAKPDVLVDTDWVAGHADDPNVVLVEVDEDTEAYARGHIPGAIAWNWKTDLQDGVKRDFIGPADLERLMSRSGIGNDTLVVLYGGNNNWFASYAYWYLRYYGHENVKLLNGGRKRWELEGRELTGEVPKPAETSYKVKAQNRDIRAFRDDVLASIGKDNLVDVRSPQEYAGELKNPPHLPQEAAFMPGHVPTARNIPWSKAVREDDGTFKSADELKELYSSEGVDLDKPTIAYCRIGERSAHTWFVLHELLGVPGVRNYDGSWSEYGSLVGVPITLGPQSE